VKTSAEVMKPYDGNDDVIVLVLDTGDRDEKALSRLYCLCVAIISSDVVIPLLIPQFDHCSDIGLAQSRVCPL